MSLDIDLIGRASIFDTNITHNLNMMAEAAGIYEALWRPYRLHPDYKEFDSYDEECKFEETVEMYAKDVIPKLEEGLRLLLANPKKFKKYDSPNGWGVYKDFVPFVEEYLTACRDNSEALIEVSR